MNVKIALMKEKTDSDCCRSEENVRGKLRFMGKQAAFGWSGIRDILTLLLLLISATSVILVISLSRKMHEIESLVEHELIQNRLSFDHLGSEYNKLSLLLTDTDNADITDGTWKSIFDPVRPFFT